MLDRTRIRLKHDDDLDKLAQQKKKKKKKSTNAMHTLN